MSTKIYSGTNEHDGKLVHDSENSLASYDQSNRQINPPAEPFQLISYPDPRLLTPSKPVEIGPKGLSDADLTLCYGLFKCYMDMTKKLGPSVVGLAAPQCGKNVRIIIVEGVLLINPEITWLPKNGIDYHLEGCLSLPVTSSWNVKRPYGCRLKWYDMTGQLHENKFNGFKARVILHEMDHLEGKLCCGEDYPKEK